MKQEASGHHEVEEKTKEDMTAEEKVEDIFKQYDTSFKGLSDSEAKKRLGEYGPNELPEKKQNHLLRFLSFFWNPLSWAMECAAIIAAVLQDYVDLGLIGALLFFNACLGYWEEHSAGNALAALKAQLAPTAQCVRDGTLQPIAAKELVPGDVIKMKLGDVVPADCKLVHGEPAKLDQSSLTGESLPVTKYIGSEMYSGAALKEGEVTCVVYATGVNTFFGTAASLVEGTVQEGHLQSVLTKIGSFCIFYILAWVTAELAVEFGGRGKPCSGVSECQTLENALVLIIGGIPIAMPTVLSVTMAIGASQLAKRNAIVSRLTAIEELAAMDVLCSDKTGTLTLNQLTVDEPVSFTGATKEQMVFDAALCSNWENADAIDTCITSACPELEDIKNWERIKFYPFDPVGKKTMVTARDPKTGRILHTSKGAPQAVLKICRNKAEVGPRVEECILDFANRGFRALGVARCEEQDTNDPNAKQTWIMEGLLPLFDPPRHDTADTVEKVVKMGCRVKMITGDHLAIAIETGKRLNLGTDMHTTKALINESLSPKEKIEMIEASDGFAEVFPEHKYDIVKELQKAGHVVGMTGDGVNDAPALKKADIGIAVAGATDAARGAADIILLSPGLGVIVEAVIGSRKIFQRMKNYAQYSVTTCVRLCTTFAILTIVYDWFFPTIVMVVIAILNDGTIITISKDRATPSPRPDQWRLGVIFFKGIIYGSYLAASTIILFVFIMETRIEQAFGLRQLGTKYNLEKRAELRGLIYLQVSITGAAIIFVTRSVGWSWRERPGVFLMLAFAISQTAATFIGVYGFNGYPGDDEPSSFRGCGWGWALFAWIYSLIVYIPLDIVKFAADAIVLRFPKFFAMDWLPAVPDPFARWRHRKPSKPQSKKTTA